MYNFKKEHECNLCCSTKDNHRYIGRRFNKSQGFFLKKTVNDIYTNVYFCMKCNTIFSNPIPIPNNHFKRYEVLDSSQMLNFNNNMFTDELAIIKKYIKKQNIKFLDIGCGNGYLLNKLYNLNYDVYGIEPVKKFYEICIKKFPFLKNKISNKTIENFEFNKIQFDVISFNSVLEHLINPSEQINLIMNYLKPGGIIHIEVPHSNWLIAKIINFFKKLTFQNNVTNLSPMHPPYHYFEFSKKSFEMNGIINNYKVIDYYFRVSEIEYKIPLIIKKILYFIMLKTNSQKQLIIFIKKL